MREIVCIVFRKNNKDGKPLRVERLFLVLAVAAGTAIAIAAAAAGFTALAAFAGADFTLTAETLIVVSAYAHFALCFHNRYLV